MAARTLDETVATGFGSLTPRIDNPWHILCTLGHNSGLSEGTRTYARLEVRGQAQHGAGVNKVGIVTDDVSVGLEDRLKADADV